MVLFYVVSYRIKKVCLTKSRVAVNEKRVVGAGLLCNSLTRSLRKLVRRANYKVVKGIGLCGL